MHNFDLQYWSTYHLGQASDRLLSICIVSKLVQMVIQAKKGRSENFSYDLLFALQSSSKFKRFKAHFEILRFYQNSLQNHEKWAATVFMIQATQNWFYAPHDNYEKHSYGHIEYLESVSWPQKVIQATFRPRLCQEIF